MSGAVARSTPRSPAPARRRAFGVEPPGALGIGAHDGLDHALAAAQFLEQRHQLARREAVAPERGHDLDALAPRGRAGRSCCMFQRAISLPFSSAHAESLDLLEHAEELLRVVRVVPGRAHDDQRVLPPVDARAVPGKRLDLDPAPRERQHGELVVDDEPGGVVHRQERDPAHLGLGVDHELRAAEERDHLAAVLVRHLGIPDLRRAAEVLGASRRRRWRPRARCRGSWTSARWW